MNENNGKFTSVNVKKHYSDNEKIFVFIKKKKGNNDICDKSHILTIKENMYLLFNTKKHTC